MFLSAWVLRVSAQLMGLKGVRFSICVFVSPVCNPNVADERPPFDETVIVLCMIHTKMSCDRWFWKILPSCKHTRGEVRDPCFDLTNCFGTDMSTW